jgi:hypothetical protein
MTRLVSGSNCRPSRNGVMGMGRSVSQAGARPVSQPQGLGRSAAGDKATPTPKFGPAVCDKRLRARFYCADDIRDDLHGETGHGHRGANVGGSSRFGLAATRITPVHSGETTSPMATTIETNEIRQVWLRIERGESAPPFFGWSASQAAFQPAHPMSPTIVRRLSRQYRRSARAKRYDCRPRRARSRSQDCHNAMPLAIPMAPKR